VAKDRIHVVASSGLMGNFKTPESRERAKDALNERVRAAVGVEVGFVTTEEEGKYGAINSIPPEKRKDGLFLDVGGNNTKGGLFQGDGFLATNFKFGSVNFTDEAKKRGRRPETLRENLLTDPLREESGNKPALRARKDVCLAGGIVWAMATYTRPQDSDPAVQRVGLSVADFDRFRDQVGKLDQNKVRADAADKVASNPDRKKQVEAEFQRVKEAFTDEQLRGGAEVLRAVADAYEFDKKNVHFYRHGQYAWPLGYIADKSGIEKAAAAPRK
jgi:exopolyphosphatase/pppGpp-phosphohydrolase